MFLTTDMVLVSRGSQDGLVFQTHLEAYLLLRSSPAVTLGKFAALNATLEDTDPGRPVATLETAPRACGPELKAC